jgi:hypothetical protein
MNIQNINTAIISGNFTIADLDSIQDAVRFARSRLTQKNAFTLRQGARVTMTHDKLGGKAFGTVLKVKIKKADVKMDDGKVFVVPLAMLEAA